MKTLLWSSALTIVTLLGGAQHAHAWTAIRNATANPIFLLYAYEANSGVGCGYNDPCERGAHVVGWFTVAPGESLHLNENPHHNASHAVYAEDNLGHTWGETFGIPGFPRPQGIDTCFVVPPDVPGSIMYWGWPMEPHETCCGFLCEPVDQEETLFLDETS